MFVLPQVPGALFDPEPRDNVECRNRENVKGQDREPDRVAEGKNNAYSVWNDKDNDEGKS